MIKKVLILLNNLNKSCGVIVFNQDYQDFLRRVSKSSELRPFIIYENSHDI